MSILSGLGAISSIINANNANRSRNRLLDRQSSMVDEAVKAARGFDERRMAEYEQSVQAGDFDPSEQQEIMRRIIANTQLTAMQNAAGAGRVAGFRPGDTVLQDKIARIPKSQRLQEAQLIYSLAERARARKQQAIANTAPTVGSALFNGAGFAGQQAYNTQIPDVTGAVAPLFQQGGLDFLKPRTSQPKPADPYKMT